MKLTRQGQNLLAKALLGTEIHFTRVGIGSGDAPPSVYDLTELQHFEMWLPLVDLRITGDGTANVTAYLSNAEVTKGFPCTEHGIFALNDIGEEILFAYQNLGVDYDFIPANTGSAAKNIFLEWQVEIRDAENITAQLDLSVAYINTEDFKKHLEDEHPHPNTPNHYNDVETTAAIWATDNDNHLHKISVDNLRDLLDDSHSETALISEAELGLNANILFFEDFKSADAADNFKSKVTSAAEYGDLLGIEDPQQLRTGATYTLADQVHAEQVSIKSILKNDSGYYAKLKNPLAHAYQNGYLYRNTPATCATLQLDYQPPDFTGYPANLQRVYYAKFVIEDATGDALIDDFFSLR